MSEKNQSTENQQNDTGQTGEEQGTEQKSTVDRVIDKAQEKGITEKAANTVKNKLKGR